MPTSLTGSSPGSNPWKLGGLGWKALVRRLWRESLHDDILGRAAQLAYYFLLALFPALLFLTALYGSVSAQTDYARVDAIPSGLSSLPMPSPCWRNIWITS